MGKRFLLKELAAARGVSEEWYIDHVVVPMCNTQGQAETARQLGTTQATISNWLKPRYVNHPFWMRRMSAEDRASIDQAVARHKYKLIEGEIS